MTTMHEDQFSPHTWPHDCMTALSHNRAAHYRLLTELIDEEHNARRKSKNDGYFQAQWRWGQDVRCVVRFVLFIHKFTSGTFIPVSLGTVPDCICLNDFDESDSTASSTD